MISSVVRSAIYPPLQMEVIYSKVNSNQSQILHYAFKYTILLVLVREKNIV